MKKILHRSFYSAIFLGILSLIITGAPFSAAVAQAPQERILSSYINTPEAVGQGRLSVLFWDVYDLTLYAPQGRYDETQPHALVFDYKMDVTRDEIIKATIQEMKKLGRLSPEKTDIWSDAMRSVFIDTTDGLRLHAIRDSQGHFQVYSGGKKQGYIADPAFTQAFFAIWLDEKTSEPGLRTSLLSSENP